MQVDTENKKVDRARRAVVLAIAAEMLCDDAHTTADCPNLVLSYDALRVIAEFCWVEDAVQLLSVHRDFKTVMDNEKFYEMLYVRDVVGTPGSLPPSLQKPYVRLEREGERKKTFKQNCLRSIDLIKNDRNDAKDSLWMASRQGWGGIVRRIILSPTNSSTIDVQLGNHATVLETASLREHCHVIHMAMRLGADPYIGEHSGDSALHLAVCTNKLDSVKALIDSGFWKRNGQKIHDSSEIAQLDTLHGKQFRGADKENGDTVASGKVLGATVAGADWANGLDKSRFPTILTGPLYSDSPDFDVDESQSRLRMVKYLYNAGFRRPQEVIDVAIQTAITRGRIRPHEMAEWAALLNSWFGRESTGARTLLAAHRAFY